MAIELRDLNDLDPDLVLAALTETVQRIQEQNPRLDLRRGVFAELLAYYHAVLDTQRRTNINDYLNARSMRQVQLNPALADADTVDDIVSNFRLARLEGRKSAGEVTVVVDDDTTVTVGQGSVWEARGRQYVTTRVFTAKTEATQIVTLGDRLLTPTADGNWAFTIEVEAVEEGTDSNVTKDTLVAPLTVPTGYVTSYASADFSAGLAQESVEELLVRMQEGIAARTLSNRVNMAATLRVIEAFSRVTAMSIVGHGDGELKRAFHSILPIALGGRCDWYVRTQEQAQAINVQKTCTLVEKNDDGTGVWQFGLAKDDAPGFFEVRHVRPLDADTAFGGFSVVEDVRGFDLSAGGVLPDVTTAEEAAYSAYSTAAIRFLNTESHADYTVGDTEDFDVTVVVLPLIAEIQSHVGGRDVRPYGGDALVKAPVPCFLTLNFTINKKTGQDDPDLNAIRTAVCEAANTVGFVGQLYAGQLQDVIHNYLSNGQTVGAVDMHGRLRYPDGTTFYLRDSEVLTVPDLPANMVTANTVQFFAAPEDVGITVATKLPSAL